MMTMASSWRSESSWGLSQAAIGSDGTRLAPAPYTFEKYENRDDCPGMPPQNLGSDHETRVTAGTGARGSDCAGRRITSPIAATRRLAGPSQLHRCLPSWSGNGASP